MQSFASSSYLIDLVSRQKAGQPSGIYSVCSANTYVLQACMQRPVGDIPLLIESTCNQVNPFGGYTGMTAADFAAYVAETARRMQYPQEHIILGGDHLGPYPWRNEAAQQAMDKACRMVQEYVAAGYRKIHLDASMHCGDDDAGRPLSKQVSAERAVQMCLQAERAAQTERQEQLPVYIIGTEVPVPGGQQNEEEGTVQVTTCEDIEETLHIFKEAFFQQGLQSAWERVIALVVQPGVEFDEDHIIEYRRDEAAAISRMVAGLPGIVFEAHSTDYQQAEALRQMVEDHFAILKVGPGLTFAMREAVFALAYIEEEWLAGREGVEVSGIREALDKAMLEQPQHWQQYFSGSRCDVELARSFSYSDRIRYYWNTAGVEEALQKLLHNLQQAPIPQTLLSQYLPQQYRRVRSGTIAAEPRALLLDRITEAIEDYEYACGVKQ